MNCLVLLVDLDATINTNKANNLLSGVLVLVFDESVIVFWSIESLVQIILQGRDLELISNPTWSNDMKGYRCISSHMHAIGSAKSYVFTQLSSLKLLTKSLQHQVWSLYMYHDTTLSYYRLLSIQLLCLVDYAYRRVSREQLDRR